MPPVLRSALSVMVGFLAINFIIILFTLLLATALHQRSGHPTPGYLVFNVIYSFLACLAGGYLCALVARRKPVQHAATLAGIMLAFGLFSYVHYVGTQPVWYRLMMIAVPPLLVIGGGALFGLHERRAHMRTL